MILSVGSSTQKFGFLRETDTGYSDHINATLPNRGEGEENAGHRKDTILPKRGHGGTGSMSSLRSWAQLWVANPLTRGTLALRYPP